MIWGYHYFWKHPYRENMEFLSNSPVKTKHTQKDLMAQVGGKSQFPREKLLMLLIEEILHQENLLLFTAFLISQMVFDLPSTVWISLGGSHVWLIGPWWSLEPKDPGPWDPFLAWRMAYKACQVILPNPNWDDLSANCSYIFLNLNLSRHFWGLGIPLRSQTTKFGVLYSARKVAFGILSPWASHLVISYSSRLSSSGSRNRLLQRLKHGFQTKTPISDKFSCTGSRNASKKNINMG